MPRCISYVLELEEEKGLFTPDNKSANSFPITLVVRKEFTSTGITGLLFNTSHTPIVRRRLISGSNKQTVLSSLCSIVVI